MTDDIHKFSQFIRDAKDIVVFTGAGISTDSGISDYRSKGGLWDRYQPVTIQEFLSSRVKQIEYWQRKKELYQSFQSAQPNKAHFAMVSLEKAGKLRGVITQNIDGLHQLAGLSQDKICEIHGNNRETICLSCDELTDWSETFQRLEVEEVPLCLKCGGLLKPNTISFGQNLNAQTLNNSVFWARTCDLMIVCGSSLVVEPAASLPRIAKENAARLVIITNSQTPLDSKADLKFENSINDVFLEVMDFVEN